MTGVQTCALPILDFVKRLVSDPTRLRILGDGSQNKSYIAVDDVIAAVLHASERTPGGFATYNVATGDTITVLEIAGLAVDLVVGRRDRTTFEFTGGDRGWKGDVPIVRINIDAIRALGWPGARPAREAMRWSMASMLADVKKGLL